MCHFLPFFFSSRRRHTRWPRDWSSDVCSSDLYALTGRGKIYMARVGAGVKFCGEWFEAHLAVGGIESEPYMIGIEAEAGELADGELAVGIQTLEHAGRQAGLHEGLPVRGAHVRVFPAAGGDVIGQVDVIESQVEMHAATIEIGNAGAAFQCGIVEFEHDVRERKGVGFAL